jgi:protein N-terminal methyltransferase
LPRIDSVGSRLFLLHLLPELSTVPSAFSSTAHNNEGKRFRALDVGAGVGRVTCDVLLHLVHDIVTLEPVEPFIQQAITSAKASLVHNDPSKLGVWKGLKDKTKSVTFVQGPLQSFDPNHPLQTVNFLDRLGYVPQNHDADSGFDVVWCQWCLGHLEDTDLIAFFRRSRASLRQSGRSVIIVKENLCPDDPGPSPCMVFDDSDSSMTRSVNVPTCAQLMRLTFLLRSDLAWKQVFEQAGLALIKEQVQEGLPEGLYAVKA